MIDGVIPFVYLMRRSDGSWKIGFSVDPLARRHGLQSANRGIKFKVERMWKRVDAYRIERLAHRLLRLRLDLRADGQEAFRAPRKIILAALEEAMFIADGVRMS